MDEHPNFVEFVRRVRAGDPEAAAELFRRFEPLIRREVRLRLEDERLGRLFDSMDVCQSVLASFFVRVAAGQYDLEQPGQLLGLLVKMARNKLASAARRQSALKRDHRRDGGAGAMETVACGDASPSRVLQAKDLLEEFRRRLTDEEQSLAGPAAARLAWEEVARRVGGARAARRMQLARAVERVSQELGLDDEVRSGPGDDHEEPHPRGPAAGGSALTSSGGGTACRRALPLAEVPRPAPRAATRRGGGRSHLQRVPAPRGRPGDHPAWTSTLPLPRPRRHARGAGGPAPGRRQGDGRGARPARPPPPPAGWPRAGVRGAGGGGPGRHGRRLQGAPPGGEPGGGGTKCVLAGSARRGGAGGAAAAGGGVRGLRCTTRTWCRSTRSARPRRLPVPGPGVRRRPEPGAVPRPPAPTLGGVGH
ncbi:MAG: ECF-type sigma factor [Gemmataceae bacterium]